MSYKKIACRFNNKKLSSPCIESLKQVNDIPLLSSPREIQGDNRCRRDESINDWGFLQLCTNCPDELDTPIPNLIKMATDMPPNDGSFQLYTNETRTEFHHLLLELLDRFKKALDALIALDQTKVSMDPGQAVMQFNRNGYALLRLSKGRAFQMHLENVEPSLQDLCQPDIKASFQEQDEQKDGELEAILSQAVFSPMKGLYRAQKLKPYSAWLRLMVGHFDAVEILVQYVNSPYFLYDSISIDLLVAPPTGEDLLPWPQLFEDKFLPTEGALNYYSRTTNDEIYKYLKDGISKAFKAKEAADRAQQTLKEYENSQKIDSSLQPDKDVADDKEVTNDIRDLHTELGELSVTDRFFLNLEKLSFKGALHCEACLASLLPAFTQDIPPGDSKYKDMNILSKMNVEYPLSCLFLSSDSRFVFL